MGRKAVGYELAATRLLNRGRKLSNADSEQRARAELLISAANAFALLDLASAIREQRSGAGAEVSVEDESADAEDEAEEDEEPREPVGVENE